MNFPERTTVDGQRVGPFRVAFVVAILGGFVAASLVATIAPASASSTVSQSPAAHSSDASRSTTTISRSKRHATTSTIPEVDILQSSAAEVHAVLVSTKGQRDAAEKELARSKRAAAAAAREVAAAEAREETAKRKADVLNGKVKEAAVDMYVGGKGELPLGAISGDDVRETSFRATILRAQTEKLDDLFSRQKAAKQALKVESDSRRSAAQSARDAVVAAESKTRALHEVEVAQAAVADKVQERLDAALAEAAALEAIDGEAAAELAAAESSLGVEAGLGRPSPGTSTPGVDGPDTTPSTVPGPTTSVAPPTTGPTPTTTKSHPGTTAPQPTTTRPRSTTTVPHTTTTVPSPTVSVVKVSGFWVNATIAKPFGDLIAASKSAGLVLGGGAYRDRQQQIELRKAHCGTSDYDIYQKPASQCSPPTAPPGKSMHEQGLAIDFTCSGKLIGTHSDPCFIWLAKNAATYGFYNLKSEPWHWSTNGK